MHAEIIADDRWQRKRVWQTHREQESKKVQLKNECPPFHGRPNRKIKILIIIMQKKKEWKSTVPI